MRLDVHDRRGRDGSLMIAAILARAVNPGDESHLGTMRAVG